MATLRASHCSADVGVGFHDCDKEFSDDDDENTPLTQDIYGGR